MHSAHLLKSPCPGTHFPQEELLLYAVNCSDLLFIFPSSSNNFSFRLRCRNISSVAVSRVLLDFQRLSGSRSDVPCGCAAPSEGAILTHSHRTRVPRDTAEPQGLDWSRNSAKAQPTCLYLVFLSLAQLCGEKEPISRYLAADCV